MSGTNSSLPKHRNKYDLGNNKPNKREAFNKQEEVEEQAGKEGGE